MQLTIRTEEGASKADARSLRRDAAIKAWIFGFSPFDAITDRGHVKSPEEILEELNPVVACGAFWS
jgi:hypothetical protein